jgi:hypothetical protein
MSFIDLPLHFANSTVTGVDLQAEAVLTPTGTPSGLDGDIFMAMNQRRDLGIAIPPPHAFLCARLDTRPQTFSYKRFPDSATPVDSGNIANENVGNSHPRCATCLLQLVITVSFC